MRYEEIGPKITSCFKNIVDRAGGLENKDSLVVNRKTVKLPKEPFQKATLSSKIRYCVGHSYVLGENLNFMKKCACLGELNCFFLYNRS